MPRLANDTLVIIILVFCLPGCSKQTPEPTTNDTTSPDQVSADQVDVMSLAESAEPAEPEVWGKPLPKPDLDTLAQRCRPDYPYDENNTAFEELLYLRERPDPKAFPVLKAILQVNVKTSRTFGFAAIQALYTLDTEAARALLKQYLDTPHVYGEAHQAIHYTQHWQMQPAPASAMIDRYYLTSLSDDITVKAKINPEITKRGSVGLEITISISPDQTDQTLAWPGFVKNHANIYAASILYLRDTEGRYYMPNSYITYDLPARGIVRVSPDQPHTIKLTLVPEQTDTGYRVVAGDRQFDLPGPGLYDAVILFEQQKIHANWKTHRGEGLKEGESFWGGRVVSQPVRIMIGEPSR